MTKIDRLQLENELMREYRLWYNPANISEQELTSAIESQKKIVEMFEASYKQNQNEDTAMILVEEVMKLEIWKDIFLSRNPEVPRPVKLD